MESPGNKPMALPDRRERAVLDGNAAVARVAHACSEIVAIYPITPSSPMSEATDAFSAAGKVNLWGAVPRVTQMQSEAGAAGALHGAATTGTCATTFTSSQGLLLMIPVMHKLAGELTPAVIHVAARTVATHALSIFGDHSDVMAVRGTGWAMLASTSVQEAHDLAAVAHAATLRARVPFLHFFDGFRTSHEEATIEVLASGDVRSLVEGEALAAFRARGLTPDAPVLRGTSANPDTYFQAREAANPAYDALPGVVEDVLAEFAALTGRAYRLVEYAGAPDAERVVVVLGSAWHTVRACVDALVAQGEKVGAATLHLYRPFPAGRLVEALPRTVRRIAVLDRTKEPGAPGEPLLADVALALLEGWDGPPPRLAGGRYGLSSREFTPAMARAVFDELKSDEQRRRFTVGLDDDVTHLSLPVEQTRNTGSVPAFRTPRVRGVADLQAVFFGLGSDGSVGAAKATAAILGADGRYAQGYFVYDSRKAGATTASHLRVAAHPIDAPYLIEAADVVAVHQFALLRLLPTLDIARDGATVLLASPHAEDTWAHLPREIRSLIVERHLDVHVIDAHGIAARAGLGRRVNTVLQAAFFHLSGVLDWAIARERLGAWIEEAYGRQGEDVVAANLAVVDVARAALRPLVIPAGAPVDGPPRFAPLPPGAPAFVKAVTAPMIVGLGETLPVSAFPPDGTWPTATSQWEKRGVNTELPIWDETLCIDCGKCAIACPHSAIRLKVAPPESLAVAPDGLRSKPYRDRVLAGQHLIVQVSPDDCTGCGICVDVCPAVSKTDPGHRSLDMAEATPALRDAERAKYAFFAALPEVDRTAVRHDMVRGVALLRPLFEFSMACSGCGETPYLKLLTQLWGDRLLVANATGCSSIFGGNLPTTPWAVDDSGRGPAWSNSLFEDNAEFGYGIALAQEHRRATARSLLAGVPGLDGDLVAAILDAGQGSEADVQAQRARIETLKQVLTSRDDDASRRALAAADDLVDKVVWIVGGDGWAYDIGFGGLDHVLASGADVNILVLDTQVYSNTGGQASKATPRGAMAAFAAGGKATRAKDLGAIARTYPGVYVAQVAIGADQQQSVRALLEAQAWRGPSLVIAYSTCIEHGIDMATSMSHQGTMVDDGAWPLYRRRPEGHPEAGLRLDSRPPTGDVRAFMAAETRFAALARTDPERAAAFAALAQDDADARLASLELEK